MKLLKVLEQELSYEDFAKQLASNAIDLGVEMYINAQDTEKGFVHEFDVPLSEENSLAHKPANSITNDVWQNMIKSLEENLRDTSLIDNKKILDGVNLISEKLNANDLNETQANSILSELDHTNAIINEDSNPFLFDNPGEWEQYIFDKLANEDPAMGISESGGANEIIPYITSPDKSIYDAINDIWVISEANNKDMKEAFNNSINETLGEVVDLTGACINERVVLFNMDNVTLEEIYGPDSLSIESTKNSLGMS